MTGAERLVLSGGLIGGEFFPVVMEEAANLAPTSTPTILFDQFASTTLESFKRSQEVAAIIAKKYAVRSIGYQEDFRTPVSPAEAADTLERADILYVGGGSTKRLRNRWDDLGITSRIVER